MWVDISSGENDKSARALSYADIPVRNAANAELQKKGWSLVSDNPDVLLSYDILVERSTEQKSDPVYSQASSRSYYNTRTKRWQIINYPSQFLGYQNYDVPVKDGTVTISMMDADTDKTVWQGWATERLNYARPSAEEISSSVTKIFKNWMLLLNRFLYYTNSSELHEFLKSRFILNIRSSPSIYSLTSLTNSCNSPNSCNRNLLFFLKINFIIIHILRGVKSFLNHFIIAVNVNVKIFI